MISSQVSQVSQASQAAQDLTVLAEVGPWPVVSRLIGYRDRLWFANSVKGRNHNSADVYSYDLNGGDVRYERHLFSQDAGRPVVADGLLYWPFEDARFSVGFGHFMMTDGVGWHQGVIPTGRIFHNHAMAAGNELMAATSAWRAHLDLSTDGGTTWRQLYDHPTPERRVSRIVELITLGPQTFGYLVSRGERTLTRYDGASVEPVPSWPSGHPVLGLTTYRDHVYGLVETAAGPMIWRTDGRQSVRLAGPEMLASDADGSVARDLTADERGLWVVTTTDTGGWIWHSVDGRTWTRRHGFDGGRGIELSSYRGRLFLGGTDDTRGIGLLWGLPGRPTPTAGETTASRSGLPEGLPHLDHQTDWTVAGAELDRKLADPAMYQDHGRRLRDALFGLMAKKPPAGFLTKRLHAEMPEQPLSLIGGAVQVPSVLMGRALLLWGISRLGEAELAAGDRIPLVFLKESWNRPSNRAEKYFDTLPFALWAIASTGQDDKATINTLIERLDQPDDPLWLRGDVVGALSALTRERFGYDVAAWQRWWTSASTVWP